MTRHEAATQANPARARDHSKRAAGADRVFDTGSDGPIAGAQMSESE